MAMVKESIRDTETGVLAGWGYRLPRRSGFTIQAEAPSFTLTPGQYAWNGEAWVPYSPTLVPDARGFEVALHDIFPGQDFMVFWAAFMPYSPLFLDAIRQGTWALATALIGMALQQQAITEEQYQAIKDTAALYNIPVAL